ncbi:MAG TPA: hypothetical protein PK159_01350 [Steroidobacteraceae bacterium]|nr:hypothetical protein [Steroidobacteraceae bacterium]
MSQLVSYTQRPVQLAVPQVECAGSVSVTVAALGTPTLTTLLNVAPLSVLRAMWTLTSCCTAVGAIRLKSTPEYDIHSTEPLARSSDGSN